MHFLGKSAQKSKAAHPVNYFPGFLGKNIKNCPPSKLSLFTSLQRGVLESQRGNLSSFELFHSWCVAFMYEWSELKGSDLYQCR